jgi:uncharacterized protein (DUF1697 family)
LTTYAALVRGINVGGKNKLPMPQLKALFEELGHSDVVTYIQSGNVVFRASRADARAIEQRITDVFGLDVAVVLRTAAELAATAAGNPFLAKAGETKRLYVTFLDRKPAAGAVEQLDPDRSPGDRFSLDGRELYLDLATGAGRTKLTLDYFERKLGVKGTARNWNTVLKLAELTGS